MNLISYYFKKNAQLQSKVRKVGNKDKIKSSNQKSIYVLI